MKGRNQELVEYLRGFVAGMVERVARTDRLSTALWSAMTTQHMRRGEDWLLKKGGFQRLQYQTQF